MKANYLVWPAIQLTNFYFIPIQHRFVNVHFNNNLSRTSFLVLEFCLSTCARYFGQLFLHFSLNESNVVQQIFCSTSLVEQWTRIFFKFHIFSHQTPNVDFQLETPFLSIENRTNNEWGCSSVGVEINAFIVQRIQDRNSNRIASLYRSTTIETKFSISFSVNKKRSSICIEPNEQWLKPEKKPISFQNVIPSSVVS